MSSLASSEQQTIGSNHPGASRPDLPRRIGFWGGCAIMVGVTIGSGIFRAPAEIAGHFGSPWAILGLWVLGGLLALAGALTYAELAAMFPNSGGIYVFLREGYGCMPAFVFGWAYMMLIKPFAAGGIAIVFATHLNGLLGVDWDPRGTTCAVILVLTAVNTLNVHVGTGVALVFTALKVAALVAIIALAVGGQRGSAANFHATPAVSAWYTALATGFAQVAWTYDGWSDIGSVAGEVRNPQRMLPRIYIGGALAVTVLYVLVNAVYLWVMPLAEMRLVENIAPTVMERLVGSGGAMIVTIVVLISTLGSTHSSIITGARVTFAQARDGLLFRPLSRIEPHFQTPAVALWVQAALSCIAIYALGTYQSLIEGFVFVMWIFYGLAATALIILRVRRPEALRPFRCPGYPLTPTLFIASAALITGLAVYDNPSVNLGWLGVLLTGAPLYYAWRAARRSA